MIRVNEPSKKSFPRWLLERQAQTRTTASILLHSKLTDNVSSGVGNSQTDKRELSSEEFPLQASVQMWEIPQKINMVNQQQWTKDFIWKFLWEFSFWAYCKHLIPIHQLQQNWVNISFFPPKTTPSILLHKFIHLFLYFIYTQVLPGRWHMEKHSPNYRATHFVYYDLKAFKHLGKVILVWKLIYRPLRSFSICSIPLLLPNSMYLQAVNGQGTLPHIHLGN